MTDPYRNRDKEIVGLQLSITSIDIATEHRRLQHMTHLHDLKTYDIEGWLPIIADIEQDIQPS